MVKNGDIRSAQFSFLPTGSGFGWTKGSSSGGGSGNGNGETFTSIAAMETWLSAQPDNTTATAYTVKLNVSDLGGRYDTSGSVGYVLKANSTKYVYLDLSGSTITSIGGDAFMYASLTSITVPNSVTAIYHDAFQGCTSLTSVTFEGTITYFDPSSTFPGDLRTKYLATGGGIGTYTRPSGTSNTWTKQQG